jgi:hypothetical protein
MAVKSVVTAMFLLIFAMACSVQPGFSRPDGDGRGDFGRDRPYKERDGRGFQRVYTLEVDQHFAARRGQTLFLKQELLRLYPELRQRIRDFTLVEVEIIGQARGRAYPDEISLRVGRESSRPYSLSRDGRSIGRRMMSLTIPSYASRTEGAWQLEIAGELYLEKLYLVVDEGRREGRFEPPPRVDPPPRPGPPERGRPFDRYDPVGVVDSARGGAVVGWAVDQDEPDKSIEVHVYAGAPAGKGGVLVSNGLANRERPDVNRELGVGGRHGFSVPIPKKYRGQPVFVYGIDTSGQGVNTMLRNSGIILQ